MEVFVDGQLRRTTELVADYLPTPDPLDGEVHTAQDIIDILSNSVANAGKSYYMRGGNYGNLLLARYRPASEISFITYPYERALFGDLRSEQSINITMDGNDVNTYIAPMSDCPNDDYGLWFKGSGILGNSIPPVNSVMVFPETSATEWNDNLTFRNFRVGGEASTDEADWRRQHGIVFGPHSRNITFNRGQIAYLGSDLDDLAVVGDFEAGGYGIWWAGGGTDWGSYTFTEVRMCQLCNDLVQYGPKNPDGVTEVLMERMLFHHLFNHGLAHADMLQAVGGSTKLTIRDSIYMYGTDWLLHGGNPGAKRLWDNVLFGDPTVDFNLHQIVLGKNSDFGLPSYGASDYEWRNCTINLQVQGIQMGSADGSATVSNNVMSNSIWRGGATPDGVLVDNYFNDDGVPNIFITGSDGTKLAGDTSAVVTYDPVTRECTSHPTKGFHMPADYPFDIGD